MESPLVILVPTRGRPQNVERLLKAWVDTEARAHLLFLIDVDDETRGETLSLISDSEMASSWMDDPKRIVPWLNQSAPILAEEYPFVGFMGDDHLPLTPNWDSWVVTVLQESPGIVYCNDLFQGENLPTQVFMSSEIIRTLGYMAPPGLQHMYPDNAWRQWGIMANCLTYLPEVVIEHLHPHAGKAEVDLTYTESQPFMDDDLPAWQAYCETDIYVDAALIRKAIHGD